MNELIKKFYQIRDLPYHISTNNELGSDCEDKAKMLVAAAKSLGFEARTRIALFDWEVLHLPNEVTRVPHDSECSHFFVELRKPDGTWINLDPTWNKELSAAGLAVQEWDGEQSTSLAMEVKEILSPEESQKYIENIDYEEDYRINRAFYEAINSYCDSFLTKGAK